MIIPLPPDDDGAAFIQRAGGEHIAAQRFAGTVGELLPVPRITGHNWTFSRFSFMACSFSGFALARPILNRVK